MKLDELRDELHRLADEVEPAAPDLLAVHRRAKRRRYAAVSAAAVLVLVAGVAIAAVTRSGGNTVRLTSPPHKLVSSTDLHRADVVVVPDDAAVQQVLEDSPLVTRYARLGAGTRPASSAGTSSALAAPVSSGEREALCALTTRGGFVVEAAQTDRSIAADLRAAIGANGRVFDITEGNSADLEIFMTSSPMASAAEVDAVRRALTADSTDVAGFTFLDHQAAYEVFKREFADQPALVQGTTPDSLPESFRVNATTPAAIATLRDRFQRFPGVDTVITSRGHEQVDDFVAVLPGVPAPASCTGAQGATGTSVP